MSYHRDGNQTLEVIIENAAGADLEGELTLPEKARGIVIFAHGSGSSRHSPRNQYVAASLHNSGFATLLFDLLTEEEGRNRRLVFGIPLLAERLVRATYWIHQLEETAQMPIGYFGASTGAAAAIEAAARSEIDISALVSRGGRPDLAPDFLPLVKAPSLFIVGECDYGVIELNRSAFEQLRCEKELKIVQGATHLFEEPGTLDNVIVLARDWYRQHLGSGVPRA